MFYFAEILLGLEFIHDNNILYRDLKPENIFIDIDGHIRLADFGLSKIISESELTKTFCGSAEYMTPEMLYQKPYSYGVDYYSLGAILYEMVSGLPPYYSSNQGLMFDRILHEDLCFDVKGSKMSKSLVDLLKLLLHKDPTKRIQKGQLDLIKSHPWCKQINWE
jgi:serum/glucocorticoid-regulated kinase 2